MQNKTIVIAVLIALASGVALWLLLRIPETSVKENVSPTAEKETVNKTEYTFSGEGRQTLGPIKLKDGLAIIHAKNSTGKNSSFTVEVTQDENNDGQLQEGEGWTGVGISVGYEAAESYNGEIAFKAYDANYFIFVDGGRWEITVTQPEKLKKDAQALERVEGSDDTVTEKFFLKEGTHTFRATYTGDGVFIVKLYDEDGNATRRLVNEIGNTDLTFEYKNVFDGNYVFGVNAFGPWSIEVK